MCSFIRLQEYQNYNRSIYFYPNVLINLKQPHVKNCVLAIIQLKQLVKQTDCKSKNKIHIRNLIIYIYKSAFYPKIYKVQLPCFQNNKEFLVCIVYRTANKKYSVKVTSPSKVYQRQEFTGASPLPPPLFKVAQATPTRCMVWFPASARRGV